MTVVLGMSVYGRGWFSAYFADLVTALLGIFFSQIRIYYSGTLPAVLQTPVRSPIMLDRSHIGPIARAVGDVIEGLCDQVIVRGRRALAVVAGVDAANVGFDQRSGKPFVLDGDRNCSILEIAKIARVGSSMSGHIERRSPLQR